MHGSPPAVFSRAFFHLPPASSEIHPPSQRATPTSSESHIHLLREPHPPPQRTAYFLTPQRPSALSSSPLISWPLLSVCLTCPLFISSHPLSPSFHSSFPLSFLFKFLLLLFSYQVVSNSLWPHGLQHAKIPCPSPSPGDETHIHWVSDAIQPPSFVFPLSCLQCFPASGSFPVSQFFAWGGQSVGASASAPILPMNILFFFSNTTQVTHKVQ